MPGRAQVTHPIGAGTVVTPSYCNEYKVVPTKIEWHAAYVIVCVLVVRCAWEEHLYKNIYMHTVCKSSFNNVNVFFCMCTENKLDQKDVRYINP